MIHIDRLETWWLRFGALMLVTFLLIVGYDAFARVTEPNAHATHGSTSIPVGEVASTPPFDEPGLHRRADGKGWDAVYLAYTFGFLPAQDIVVPAGEPITFKVSSLDVVHGFQIPGRTNVNMEILPGHVTEAVQTFDEPGRYLILCHEYCGSGHHVMVSHVTVVEADEFDGSDAFEPTPEEQA